MYSEEADVEQSYYKKRVRVSSSQVHPVMELHGRRFHCNGQLLSLDRKPLASKIIAAFMQKADLSLHKDELLQIMVEGSSKAANRRFEQYSWTRGQSLNRLMSRLRIEFAHRFQGVTPQKVYWFHYDSLASRWLLYKLPGEGADGKLYA